MKTQAKKAENTSSYMEEHEYTANKYVMRCFGVTMLALTVAFVLNIFGVFIIDKQIMMSAYIPYLVIYAVTFAVTRKVPLTSPKTKFFIFFAIILAFTILGSLITYHVVLISFLPFLCATMYSSKRFMWYIYGLTVISTAITVYCGYYFGLCDANMALLTTGTLSEHSVDGQFILTKVNENPPLTLFLFFVLPRCIAYSAFMSICNSIFEILSGSVEKARLTSELEKAKTEAENANQAKTRFLARISHEIRTPINAVMGINQMIIQESSEPEIRQYANDVKDSSYLVLSIINDILDSTKIESGKMELVPVNYEMGSLLNDVYNMTAIRAKEKKLNLIFNISPDIPRGYFGDDKRIRQILLNLLSNGVKYTEKGTVTLNLSYEKIEDNCILHFSIKDTGIGIKTEDIGKIYDEFHRMDLSRNNQVEGTGLGMPIVQNLLKLMDSELCIKSEYEKGSEFSFDIAQKIVNPEPLGDFRSKTVKASENNGKRTLFTAPEAKVLVVDDSVMNIKVFKGLLKNTKMKIYESASGMKCLDMVKEIKFDMIFLDHMMPEMDGIETLHKMRDDKLCDGVPVIMLTANAISGDREMYISEGFDDFLSKPIIPDKLDEMIIHYLPEKLIETINGEKYVPVVKDEPVMEEIETVTGNSGSVIEKIKGALPEINTESGLATCVGDEDFYLEIFTDFTELKIKEELVKFMEADDHDNYCIRIHGFKNSAYSVGATALGDLSFEMEKLSREGLPEEIKKMQASLFEQYDRIRTQFNLIMHR